MGRGNWCPSQYESDRGANFYYVPTSGWGYENEGDEFDQDLYDMEHEDLIQGIRNCLPKSFYSMRDFYVWKNGRDERVIFRNKLYEVVLADNEWSIAVCFYVREDAPAFALGNITKVSERFFKKLGESYDLYFRDGAWMSGRSSLSFLYKPQ